MTKKQCGDNSYRSLATCALPIHLVSVGCDKSGSGRSGSRATAQAAQTISSIESELGLKFPADTKLLEQDDGGSSQDEYHEWLLFSASPIQLPASYGELVVPTDSTLKTIQVSLAEVNGSLKRDPVRATASGRVTAVYEYRISKLEMNNGGTYCLVMRFRVH